mgnify:FL=1
MSGVTFTIPDNNDPDLIAVTTHVLANHIHPMMHALAQVYPAEAINRALVAALSNMIASSVVQYGRPEDLSTLIDWAVDTLRDETRVAYVYMSAEGETRQ